jgi:hypothetical protein|tara:strand:+ start:66 stop:518 length:453 start_codon:yes stop_codon:yes gene_type:complete
MKSKLILVAALCSANAISINKLTIVDKDGNEIEKNPGYVPEVEFNEDHPEKEVVGGKYTQAKLAEKSVQDFWNDNAKSDTPEATIREKYFKELKEYEDQQKELYSPKAETKEEDKKDDKEEKPEKVETENKDEKTKELKEEPSKEKTEEF